MARPKVRTDEELRAIRNACHKRWRETHKWSWTRIQERAYQKRKQKKIGAGPAYDLDILEAFTELHPICGVYAFLLGSEVVYVGQSRNIRSRVGYHPNKIFDRIMFLELPPEDLNAVEFYLIEKYKPKYNTNGGPWKPAK